MGNVSGYKAARGILAPTDEPAEVSIANARDEILKELSGAGGSVSEVAERVKEMGNVSDIEKGTQQLASILGVPVVTVDNRSELHKLWDSTAAFHKRFGTMEEPDFEDAQMRVLFEEFYEFIDAMRKGYGQASEFADFIVVGMGLLMASGYKLEQLQAAMTRVAEKNDAKTLETHAKDNKGKVAKREATTGNGDAGSA